MTCQDSGQRPNALDYIKDGIVVLDASGAPVFVDAGLFSFLGLDHGSDPLPPAEMLNRIQFQDGMSLQDVTAVIGEAGSWCGEAVGLTLDDHAVHLGVSGRRLDQEEAGPFGSLLTFRNVTRERMMARRIQESQQMELVDKLTRGIAHEFKNLLTIIMAYGSLLELDAQDKKSAEEITKIMQTAERANEVVRRMVRIARRPPPTIEATDLNAVMTEVNALLAKTLPAKLTLKTPESHRMPMVQADAGSLIRAVVHLALNAAEAMSEEGELSVHADVVEVAAADLDRFRPLSSPGQHVRITVADSGIGMTQDVQKHLFDPFFTTKEDGSGLGMCFVREVVEEVGGAVRVCSEPGKGATVSLYLPVLGGVDIDEQDHVLDPGVSRRSG